jgi:hypothetical protein
MCGDTTFPLTRPDLGIKVTPAIHTTATKTRNPEGKAGMQVRCTIYGLLNVSTGVECVIEREHLDAGQSFHYQDQDYIIVSVVESQGRWSANVVPETQRRFLPWRPFSRRSPNGIGDQEAAQVWYERLAQVKRKVQELEEEREGFGARLDHLMGMLEKVTKESEGPRPEDGVPRVGGAEE